MGANLPHEGDKLDSLYTGPCEVIARIGSTGRYTVSLPQGHVDVHQERLQIYLPRINGIAIPLMYFQPKEEIPENDDYLVDEIMGHRLRHGRYQWRVKWKGCSHDYDTWEGAESFLHAVQKDWLDYNARHGISTKLDSYV